MGCSSHRVLGVDHQVCMPFCVRPGERRPVIWQRYRQGGYVQDWHGCIRQASLNISFVAAWHKMELPVLIAGVFSDTVFQTYGLSFLLVNTESVFFV